MAADPSNRRPSNTHLLQELDALSHTLYQSNPSRRTNSLALPRSSVPPPDAPPIAPVADTHRSRPRRMSMSPFRSRPKSNQDTDSTDTTHKPQFNQNQPPAFTGDSDKEKKGIWNWKPMRAITHIGMQRLDCLFSVEVIEVQGLPTSMNGLRLCVVVRKKETKDGAVQTMPSRVLQGSASFEETLFLRCHIYCTGKPIKFEPRPFYISTIAIDATELDFGRSTVDLTMLVKESMEKSVEGARVRQWDATFPLAGKAKGGQLALKLGFQIMEDGGVGIYNQSESTSTRSRHKQSKSSFSVTSPRITRADSPSTPSKAISAMDLKAIDDFNLDEPTPAPPAAPAPDSETKDDDQDLPDFDVVDKGIEIQTAGEEEGVEESEDATDVVSVSSEVVKEVVHNEAAEAPDGAHLVRLTELDSIAKQIKALESMMIGEDTNPEKREQADEGELQRLDADEETVTREFIQLLELDDIGDSKFSLPNIVNEAGRDDESKCFISDLGKGLGCVVQTRDGGYLAAMNPLDVEVKKKETPKLAMQISRPLILPDQKPASGFELFQRLAAMGSEALASDLISLTAMDELMGKTAEQIAFEGMASAIISGRNKEGASSSAERSVAMLKTMAAAMAEGRKERIVTGIWNVKEEPVMMDEILAFSLQKIETMAVEALKVQAGVAEEEAPFDAGPTGVGSSSPLGSAISMEEWEKTSGGISTMTLMVVVQMRDPLRRYEAVGAPVMAVVQAARADAEEGFKVTGLHVGGLKLGLAAGGRRSIWDGEKQRLTAMQWLVAYGLAKVARRKIRAAQGKGGEGLVWSLSSRVLAGMWLKPMRNPDVKVPESM